MTQKERFFAKLKKAGVFWSYKKELKIEELSDSVIIEHALKYGDYEDIVMAVEIFGKERVREVWEKTMKFDTRFIKVNFLIARVFLGLKIDIDELKKKKNGRFEKYRVFAS